VRRCGSENIPRSRAGARLRLGQLAGWGVGQGPGPVGLLLIVRDLMRGFVRGPGGPYLFRGLHCERLGNQVLASVQHPRARPRSGGPPIRRLLHCLGHDAPAGTGVHHHRRGGIDSDSACRSPRRRDRLGHPPGTDLSTGPGRCAVGIRSPRGKGTTITAAETLVVDGGAEVVG
jgi:hypothetical protein